MSNPEQSPQKDWFDNVVDFFFGNKKNTKRTMIITIILLVVLNIDSIMRTIASVFNKVFSGLNQMINEALPTLIVLFFVWFGLKLLFRGGKKPPSKK